MVTDRQVRILMESISEGKSHSVSATCAAILDRLLHQADIVAINGESYLIGRKDV